MLTSASFHHLIKPALRKKKKKEHQKRLCMPDFNEMGDPRFYLKNALFNTYYNK